MASHPPVPARAKSKLSLQRLSLEAEKAAAGAAAAKQLVRSAKAELKKARKLSKTAKKAAKLALKRVEAATATSDAGKPKPTGVRGVASAASKPRAQKPPSAAEVAKVVISRMSSVRRVLKSGAGTAAAPAGDAFVARGAADSPSLAVGSRA